MEAPASEVVEAPEQHDVIELFQNARTPIPWQLWVYADRWVFMTPGAEPRTITREHLHKWVDVHTLATFGILQISFDKKIMFPLKPEAQAKLRAWLGPPTKADLVGALKKRYSVGTLIMAGVMVLLSLPMFMPGWLETKGDAAFDLVLLVWGAVTLVNAGISKLAPHRVLFLIDIVVQLGIAGWWGYGVLVGDRSWWLGLLVLLGLLGAHVSHKHYKRFATMT